MEIYEVHFYNRFACQDQTFKVQARNEFHAGRLFYRMHDRKMYYACIEYITEFHPDSYYTEEEINKIVEERKKNG